MTLDFISPPGPQRDIMNFDAPLAGLRGSVVAVDQGQPEVATHPPTSDVAARIRSYGPPSMLLPKTE